MAKGDKRKVESALDDLLEICDDTTCLHESVLGLLARDEVEKHEMRLKQNCCLIMNVLLKLNCGFLVTKQRFFKMKLLRILFQM